MKVSVYHNSLVKRILDLATSFLGVMVLLPLFPIIAILIKCSSRGPVFFLQKRTGKKGKTFKIIKFRTMRVGAEKERDGIRFLNESDGPTFKIRDDPRFTTFGKILSRSSLDEIPQFLNVLTGQMSIVGPRPLPVYEANKLTKQQKERELILPGITSPWVTEGSHTLKFTKWMKLDRDYVRKGNLATDLGVMVKTANLIFLAVVRSASTRILIVYRNLSKLKLS